MDEKRFDVLIVGAGLSGIGAAYHLQAQCPQMSYAILEGRGDIGGTWDLFRYPGVRSDSDMYTLGYSFRPWTAPKAIADGPSILEYVRETARTYGIDKKIRFNLHVRRAFWSTPDAEWTVEAERADSGEAERSNSGNAERSDSGNVVRFRCGFLFMCSGYYDYAKGYTPEFPGADRFAGRIVHPQKWTPDIDYDGKRVVVIGSGATAVTLVPEMAKHAAHVTMLQRSPTYVVSAPEQDKFANTLRKYFSGKAAYAITRWKNVLLGMLFFWFCRHYPARAKALLVGGVKAALGPDYPVERDFSPAYNPWDQRVCLVPDGDLFDSIKSRRASVVTDQIESFTETGIRLRSGATLDADLIVTATGLNLQVLSDLQITVDGVQVDLAETMAYKGMMFSGVPNLALSMGYTNASWTLKCDLTCGYVTRLLNHMAKRGYTQCCPRAGADLPKEPMLDFSSGYVQRSIAKFPKQSTKAPWRLYQNYVLDIFTLGYGTLEDGVMEFSSPARRAQELQAAG